MKQVEIIVSPSGEIKVEAKGFKGSSCLAATKDILEKLGGEQEMKKKPEWYWEETVGTAQRQKVGGLP